MRGREHEILAQARRQLGGLEFFRKMIAGELPLPPLAELMGFRFREIEPGRAVIEADPAAAFYNGHGTVHGGFAATLLDTTLGFAVNSTMPGGRAYITVDLKVTMVRALRDSVGPVRCVANAIHLGSRTASSDGRIVDAAGKLYAHGSSTFIVVDTALVEPAGPAGEPSP